MKGKKIVEVGLAAIIALSGVASAAAPAFAAPNVIYPNVQRIQTHLHCQRKAVYLWFQMKSHLIMRCYYVI